MSALLFKPATELATLVHTGQVSSTELVTAALERIEQLQPTLNAFVHIDADGALEAAAKIDRDDPRPFAGVPIAIKDTTAVAGMPYTMGSDLFGDFVPGHDSFVTRRLRDAGFVIVGKTNMPEFGILPVSEPRRFGPARNPWDTDRTPGGSSGGAAAAVAGGMVPLAHGSDGGGSIRIPAACTGLVGLKPTRGRISRRPARPRVRSRRDRGGAGAVSAGTRRREDRSSVDRSGSARDVRARVRNADLAGHLLRRDG